MTDRELLEYAAKAAGIEGRWMTKGDGDLWLFRNDFSDPWNPLTDDGDALRLAHTVPMIVTPGTARLLDGRLFGADNKDIAATRHAIVRAAAEIGKGMV